MAMNKSRYDAIIFDLFGTLVDNFADVLYHACLKRNGRCAWR